MSFVYKIWALKELFAIKYGDHYPIEIVSIIVSMIYKLKNLLRSSGCQALIGMNGNFYCHGYSYYGELGLKTSDSLKCYEMLWNIFPISNVKDIIFGTDHTFVITNDR